MVMTLEHIVEETKKRLEQADTSRIHEHLAYQFQITGANEGVFYVEVRDGRVNVAPYEYYDRDALFICSAETLLELLSGKSELAFAVMKGKLRVEGSMEQALKLRYLMK